MQSFIYTENEISIDLNESKIMSCDCLCEEIMLKE